MKIEELQHRTMKRIGANTSIWSSVILYITSWIVASITVRRVPHWIVILGLVSLMTALMHVGMFDRDTHLPFLGTAHLPSTLLKDPWHNVDADITTRVKVSDGAKGVAFWSALPYDGIQETPMKGYGDYSNAGFALAENGMATIRVKCPGRYIVRGKTLPKHIHWREVFENGLLGPVKKKDIVC